MCQEVSQGNIYVEWKPISEIITNRLIKSLTIQKYNDFVKIINIVNIKYLILPNLGGHETSSSESENLE